jgi:hypothetical protein
MGHGTFFHNPSVARQNEKVEKGEKGEKENFSWLKTKVLDANN